MKNAYLEHLNCKHKNIYFIFQPTQQFINNIQITYLHEGRISEAQHVSTSNGSSSGPDST
jgi:hypothetical protein